MPPSTIQFRLLQEFENLFKGKPYLHRNSGLGDFVAMHLYEDLYAIAKSLKFNERVDSKEWVVNLSNKRIGINARRGDGTFGELVPGGTASSHIGFSVSRGSAATIEIGAEVKILAKAMIKQIDRVKTDLSNQVHSFQTRSSVRPISVAIVGINYADYTVGYEGDRVYKTDGGRNRHPIQEAANAESRLRDSVASVFDELIFLRYIGRNEEPFEFQWLNKMGTEEEYGAALLRICREYDRRF